jgi:glycosyltransferase involved in cell wall biosynthesis
MTIRVLQVVKTSDGAQWALDQVSALVKLGLDIHVVLPNEGGQFGEQWRQTGAQLHYLKIDLNIKSPLRFAQMLRDIRKLVSIVSPDIIHSHFFNTTMALRYALGRNHPIPRVFQVPGPAHMEYAFLRLWEISSAGYGDVWIASSKYTMDLYLKAGVSHARLYLSYYGNKDQPPITGKPGLRAKYGITSNQYVIGNVNYMYPPRRYLGQIKGIKRHEDVIDALGALIKKRGDVVGLIVGGQWGGGSGYEKQLRNRAANKGCGKIIMVGKLVSEEAKTAWMDFDLAVHVPVSENCGGVIEPLMAGVPVVASEVGGIPEVIIPGKTGVLVKPGQPALLAAAMNNMLEDLPCYREMAENGKKLINTMFDVKRTSAEVAIIYKNILNPQSVGSEPFNSVAFLNDIGKCHVN